MHHLGDGASDRHHPDRAAELFERGCRHDQPIACGMYASMRVTGKGVARDLDQARALYRRACREGGAFGCVGLARMYERGVAVAQDPTRARHLYRGACRLGDPRGCYWFGRFLLDRGHVLEAFSNLAHGCENGHDEACAALREEFELDPRRSEDSSKVVSKLESACQSDHLVACLLMGARFETGRSTARSPERAASLYRRACRPESTSTDETEAPFSWLPDYHP
jgi:TPR repeat protein